MLSDGKTTRKRVHEYLQNTSEYIYCPHLYCSGLKSKQVCYFVCDWFKSGRCSTVEDIWTGAGYKLTKGR